MKGVIFVLRWFFKWLYFLYKGVILFSEGFHDILGFLIVVSIALVHIERLTENQEFSIDGGFGSKGKILEDWKKFAFVQILDFFGGVAKHLALVLCQQGFRLLIGIDQYLQRLDVMRFRFEQLLNFHFFVRHKKPRKIEKKEKKGSCLE